MNQRFPTKYYLDIKVRMFKRLLKGIAPKKVSSFFSRGEDFKDIYLSLNGDEVYPWTSPNVWNEIVEFYSEFSKPIVFEFGTGASSIAHVSNLVHLNGSYIGVESDRTWFDLVFQSLIKKVAAFEDEIYFKQTVNDNGNNDDIDIYISTNCVKIILKLRTRKKDYIAAFNSPCNVAIVDGQYRIDCVNKILETDILVDNGMLALMEAGRGSPDWWEGNLTGKNDYSIVFNEMMNLGGKVINGDGVDNWPNVNRKSPNPISYIYPKESCLLIRECNNF